MGASRSALVAATGAGEDDRIMFQELVSESIVADLVPLILEPNVQVERVFSQKRAQQRSDEQKRRAFGGVACSTNYGEHSH